MIEQLIIQAGALGIVGFVVYDQRKNTNLILEKINITMSDIRDVMGKCKYNVSEQK